MKSTFKILIVAITASAITLVFYHLLVGPQPTIIAHPNTPIVQTSYHTAAADAVIKTDFTIAAEKTIDAVVHITNKGTTRSTSPSSIWEFFYGGSSREYPRIGMGSGVIVSPDGYIITNNHVIEEASTIEVTTNDNKSFEAELVGTDPNSDIAVLKIIGEVSFPFVRFADSDQTKVGEWVLAVGNPYNLNSTVTAGIISAKSRDLNARDSSNQSFIQTDAAVNSGNSGGALVNVEGDLVGINTAITSNGMGTFIGYSFAVPSNIARKVFEDIIEFGNVQKGLLGVSGNTLNATSAEELGISNTEGFYVQRVEEDMGAKEAGLKKEDIIIKIDDTKINKFADMSGYLSAKRPGDYVQVTYLRDGEKNTVKVQLKRSPFVEYYGMRLKNLGKDEAKKYNIKKGVKVSDLFNPRLLRRGIEEGFLLMSINGITIENTDDVLALDIDNIYEIEFADHDNQRLRFIFE